MTAAEQLRYAPVAEYLADELTSQVKHEYLGGFVYAMAGASNVHNLIASNVLGSLHGRLRSKPCRPYNSDTKIRVNLPTHVRFYYPDVSVICESNPPGDSFQDRPVLIVEVLSDKTRRTDFGEKKDAYLTISSLKAYLLVEPSYAFVTVFRRGEQGFVQESYDNLGSSISLGEIQAELSLSEVYEGVEFAPEPEEAA